MKVEFRPATLKDVEEYGGKLPPIAARVWAGVIDGRIVALGGFGYLKNGSVIAFLDADDEVREKAKLSLMKAARHVLREAKARGITSIGAEASAAVDKSQPFLERLGFRLVNEQNRVYLNVLSD